MATGDVTFVMDDACMQERRGNDAVPGERPVHIALLSFFRNAVYTQFWNPGSMMDLVF
jgi:hypothetical protein